MDSAEPPPPPRPPKTLEDAFEELAAIRMDWQTDMQKLRRDLFKEWTSDLDGQEVCRREIGNLREQLAAVEDLVADLRQKLASQAAGCEATVAAAAEAAQHQLRRDLDDLHAKVHSDLESRRERPSSQIAVLHQMVSEATASAKQPGTGGTAAARQTAGALDAQAKAALDEARLDLSRLGQDLEQERRDRCSALAEVRCSLRELHTQLERRMPDELAANRPEPKAAAAAAAAEAAGRRPRSGPGAGGEECVALAACVGEMDAELRLELTTRIDGEMKELHRELCDQVRAAKVELQERVAEWRLPSFQELDARVLKMEEARLDFRVEVLERAQLHSAAAGGAYPTLDERTSTGDSDYTDYTANRSMETLAVSVDNVPSLLASGLHRAMAGCLPTLPALAPPAHEINRSMDTVAVPIIYEPPSPAAGPTQVVATPPASGLPDAACATPAKQDQSVIDWEEELDVSCRCSAMDGSSLDDGLSSAARDPSPRGAFPGATPPRHRSLPLVPSPASGKQSLWGDLAAAAEAPAPTPIASPAADAETARGAGAGSKRGRPCQTAGGVSDSLKEKLQALVDQVQGTLRKSAASISNADAAGASATAGAVVSPPRRSLGSKGVIEHSSPGALEGAGLSPAAKPAPCRTSPGLLTRAGVSMPSGLCVSSMPVLSHAMSIAPAEDVHRPGTGLSVHLAQAVHPSPGRGASYGVLALGPSTRPALPASVRGGQQGLHQGPPVQGLLRAEIMHAPMLLVSPVGERSPIGRTPPNLIVSAQAHPQLQHTSVMVRARSESPVRPKPTLHQSGGSLPYL